MPLVSLVIPGRSESVVDMPTVPRTGEAIWFDDTHCRIVDVHYEVQADCTGGSVSHGSAVATLEEVSRLKGRGHHDNT